MLADVYDAMTSEQPYRQALPTEIALTEIQRGAGVLFDPEIVPIFLELVGASAS
jgi:HD-GYP domain-containing protein (c-di-GMP phosphodiesterase class II)